MDPQQQGRQQQARQPPAQEAPKIGAGMLGFMARQGMRELAQAATLQPTQISQQSYWDAIYAHDFRNQGKDHERQRSQGQER